MRKERRGGHTEKSHRRLVQIQKLTRELIKAANESEHSGKDGEATTPQDLQAVRVLRNAQEALLESMQLALMDSVDSNDIRKQGIDRAVSQSIVMSDLAHYLVDEVRSRT